MATAPANGARTRRQSSAISSPGGPSSPATSAPPTFDLAQSMKKLSIATSPSNGTTKLQRSPKPFTPFKPAVNRASPSSAATARMSPRSPSIGRDTRSSTPSLMRKSSTSSLYSASSAARPSTSLSRRASSSTLRGSIMEPLEEPEPKPVLTANSIAKDFFTEELRFHNEGNTRTQAVVILQDACYGHRLSRPRCTEVELQGTIERPERLRAVSVGISVAYVRLGERHADGIHAIHPRLKPESIPNVPFQIYKSERSLPLNSQHVTAIHGKEWLKELKEMVKETESRWARNQAEVLRLPTHLPSGEEKVELNSGDLYLCSESITAMEGALGAVCDGVDRVFGSGPRRAFVSVRPPGHHCSNNLPSGFCWVNNVHVGISYAMQKYGATHAAILDFDLHHGDGSQEITLELNDGFSTKKAGAKGIGYFSLHELNIFPCQDGQPRDKAMAASACIENEWNSTIWNVHLQQWKTKEEFWDVYETKYSVLLKKMASFLKQRAQALSKARRTPKGVIFVSAGFDASEHEILWGDEAKVPTEFYARVTQDVIRIAAEEGLGVDGRVISVLEGGYKDRALYSGVLSHLSGLVCDPPADISASPATSPCEAEESGIGLDFPRRSSTPIQGQQYNENDKRTSSWTNTYSPSWWDIKQLNMLDQIIGTKDPTPKKPRRSTPPTYCSPTQAATNRATDPVNLRRSMSGLPSLAQSRAPTPPPPDVPWTVASFELSKLLIPQGRPTYSVSYAELQAKQAEIESRLGACHGIKKEAEKIEVNDFPAAPTRTGLRERKPKAIEPIHEEDVKESKNRRKTVAAPTILAEPTESRRRSRRLSASSILTDIQSREESLDRAASTTLPQQEISRAASTISVANTSTPTTASRPTSSLGVKKSRPAPTRTDSGKTAKTARSPVKKATAAPVKKTTSAPAKSAPKSTSGSAASRVEVHEGSVSPMSMAVITQQPESPDPLAIPKNDGSWTAQHPIRSKVKLTVSMGSQEAKERKRATNGTTAAEISNVAKLRQSIEANNQSQARDPSPPKGKTRIVIKTKQRQSTPVATPTTTSPRRSPHLSRSSSERPPSPEKTNGAKEMLPASKMPPPDRLQTPPIGRGPRISVKARKQQSTPEASKVPLPSSSPASPTIIQYQPEGPDPVAIPHTQPIQFQEPNVNTPTATPMKNGGVLSVWSPDKGIVFEPLMKAETEGHIKSEADETSVWDIPETPGKL